jgi:hypothetical protein
MALGAGDFMVFDVFLVGEFHRGFGPFSVLEEGFVVVDLKHRLRLIGGVDPGHQTQGDQKGGGDGQNGPSVFHALSPPLP